MSKEQSQTNSLLDSSAHSQSYSETARASLALAREERKRAEISAQLLTNRIALLRQEEAKAARRIAQTQAATAAAVQARAEYESRQRLRDEFERQRLEQLHAKRERLNAERKTPKILKTSEKSQKITDDKMISKSDAARATRSVREATRAALAETVAAEQRCLQERAEFSRKQRVEARKRVDGERLAKLRLFQLDYIARIAEEDAVKAQTASLVADLEREELALIQRLQNFQATELAVEAELKRIKGAAKASGRSSKDGSSAPELQRRVIENLDN